MIPKSLKDLIVQSNDSDEVIRKKRELIRNIRLKIEKPEEKKVK